MKDARGHGSDTRGEFRPNDPMPMKHGMIGFRTGGPGFSGKVLNAGAMSDAQKTVARMREQLQSTGPGHSAGILQGIKNLLGG